MSPQASSTLPVGSASADSWDEVIETRAGVPINELIDGLDDIAALAIPYARLPRRAYNVFSAEFASWSDIAGQTVSALLSRPKAGEGTVRALLTAAADAVAAYRAAATSSRVGAATAVRRLVAELDDRDRAMLSARLWAPRAESQRTLADRLGLNIAWIQRNQPRAQARLADLVADPAHWEVSDYADELARRLGPLAPEELLATELHRLKVDPSSEPAQVLLYLAGPYVRRATWFENATTAGQQQVAAAIDGVFDRLPAPSTESLSEALAALGMPRDVAITYLSDQVGLRRFGDAWVRWGDSTADKAEAVLHVHGQPRTPEDIFDAIGPGYTSLRAVREALYEDHRFIRTSRQTLGLRGWGIDEYGGVFDEIGHRIDAAGGKIHIDALVADIVAQFPDVAENSVRIYAGTLAYVTEAGMVRRRTDTDEWPPIPPLNTARGAFRNGPTEIRLAVTVTPDVLRGSGVPMRPAVADALGVSPGHRRAFASQHGEVAAAWRMSSTSGPSLGSLRAAALATGARLGDTLVLVFNLEHASLHVALIGAELAGMQRLRQLLGRTVRNPTAALAASLHCRKTEVAAVLRKRGDHELAELIHE